MYDLLRRHLYSDLQRMDWDIFRQGDAFSLLDEELENYCTQKPDFDEFMRTIEAGATDAFVNIFKDFKDHPIGSGIMLGGLLIATILVPEIMIPLAVVGVGLGGYQVYQGYKLYQQGIEQKDAAMMLGGYRAMATGTTDVVLVAVTTYLGMKTGARKVMAPGNSGSTIRLSEALKALKASWKDYTKEQLFEALGGNLKDGATVEEAEEALGTVLNRIDRPATAGRTITLTQDQVNAIEALEQLEARGLLKNPKPPVVEPPPEPGILRPRRVVIEVLQDSCFVAGTRLLTPDGDKPIESFSRGDLVLSRSEHNPEGQVEPKHRRGSLYS